MSDKKMISIVIPCYNEEKNINRTFDGLLEMFGKLPYDFEIIAVNDGSKDETWRVIREYANKYKGIVGVNQMTNFGQSAAYQAGFDISKGDYVITVSADLEIPLKNILQVIDYLEKGYDFVNTNRVGRWGTNNNSRNVKSGAANKIIAKISKLNVHDRGSGMKGFTREMIESLRLYGEMHRFIPDYLTAYGARMIEFDVDFTDRDYGQSYYTGQGRTVRVLLDLLTLTFLLYFARKPFHMMPGRLFGFTGAIIAGIGGLGGFYLLILKLMGQSIGDRPLFTVSMIFVVVGIQSMMMGMLGEIMLRTYFESTGRKTYVKREVVR